MTDPRDETSAMTLREYLLARGWEVDAAGEAYVPHLPNIQPWSCPPHDAEYDLAGAFSRQVLSDIDKLGGFEALIELANAAGQESNAPRNRNASTPAWGDVELHRYSKEWLDLQLKELRLILDDLVKGTVDAQDERWLDAEFLIESIARSHLAYKYLIFVPRSPDRTSNRAAGTEARDSFVRSWPWGPGPGDETGKIILDESKGLWASYGVLFAGYDIIEDCEIPF